MRLKYLALALALTSSCAHAFYLYPAKSVFGLDEPCLQQDATSVIDCSFKEAVTPEDYRARLRQVLQDRIKTNFPQYITDGISNKTKNQTWVVSVDVIRAARYTVNKGSTAEVFLPLTLSLKFTNILTGEVLFSTSQTQIQPVSLLTANLEQDESKELIRQKYRELLLDNLQALIDKAGQHFQPTQISTRLQKIWKGYLILDKGLDAGIGANDELAHSSGASIRVIHAEADYAVAVPIVGEGLARDMVFEKIATSTRNAVHKPKALLADIKAPAGVSSSFINLLFSDTLGESAFTLVPINPRFVQLSQSISQETDLSQDHIAGLDTAKTAGGGFRPLPDLFLRLSIAEPLVYGSKTSTGEIEHRIVESTVYGDILDGTGRVLFAGRARDRIEEDIANNMGFDVNDRVGIATKNALLDLARQFSEKVRFNRFSLKVSDVQDDVLQIADAGGQLQVGAAIKVFRQVRADDINALIPLWEARVEQRQGEIVIARLLLPISSQSEQALKPKSDDIVLLDSASQGSGGLAFCKDDPNTVEDTSKLGNIPEQVFYDIAANSATPIYAGLTSYAGQHDLGSAIADLTRNGGFRTTVNPQFFYPKDNGCLFTHYKVQQSDKTCTDAVPGQLCQFKLMTGVAIRKKDGQGAVMGTAGLSQNTALSNVLVSNEMEVMRDNAQKSVDQLLKQIISNPLFKK